MAVYKRPGSPFYWYEFQHAGERHRGSTGKTSQRAAQTVEREARELARNGTTVKRVLEFPAGSLCLEDAVLRYWSEVESSLASASDAYRDLLRLVKRGESSKPDGFFDPGLLMTQIDDDAVKGLVKWRSNHRTKPHNAPKEKCAEDYPYVSAATVNHTTIRLQALFTHAKNNWKDAADRKLKFPEEPTWKEHLLPVSKKPARVLGNDRERHDAAIRDDYSPLIEFALASSRRFEFCYSLKWSEVDREPGVIVKDGKRKPGGIPKDERVPITPVIRDILEPLRGHHSKYVFTYVARRNVDARKKGETYKHWKTGKSFFALWDQREIKKGHRYHLTYNGAKTAYRRAMKAAGLKIGFHSLRRTRATEVYEATGDVRAVQKMMGHTTVATTELYLADNVEHVRAAMEKTDARHGPPTETTHTKGSQAA